MDLTRTRGDRVASFPATATPTACWSGVFAMSLCVFALIASEFMPVSLLTPLAADLHVSEGMAGRGIGISGAFALVTSLGLTTLAGRLDRKTLLLGLTVAMCVSGGIIAVAPGYKTYLLGRALIGVVVGGFWSLSAATAMRLVPADRVPRALAIFNGGNALATVVAAPLGSTLGAVVGWRGAFVFLVPVGLVALLWQWLALPPMPVAGATRSHHPFGLLRRREVALGLAAAATLFMGQFVLFTYLRPFLETVTRVDASTLTLVLLAIGVAGFVGTTAIGAVLRVAPQRTLVVIPLVMATLAVALTVVGRHVGTVAALLALWGLVATAAPVGWWHWLARTLPDDAEAGGGAMVAVVQLAIGLGSTVGGVLFDATGARGTFAASAGLLVIASLLASLLASPGPRSNSGASRTGRAPIGH